MCKAVNEIPQSQKTKMGKTQLVSVLLSFPLQKTLGSDTLNAFNRTSPPKQERTT